MGNETSTTTAPGAPAVQSQQSSSSGAPTTPPASSDQQPVPGATEAVSNPEAKKYADEAAAARTALKAAQAELKKFQDAQQAAELAKLGDLEKAQKQLSDTQKQLDAYKARIADYAVQMAAQKLGIRDPEVAATLIRAQLTLGDDGAPTNAEELLKDLLKSKPYLKADEPTQQQQQRVTPGATNPGRGTSSGTVTKADIQAGRVPREKLVELFNTGEIARILAQQ
jgi:hypothetical protein